MLIDWIAFVEIKPKGTTHWLGAGGDHFGSYKKSAEPH
jgi:hypothetical protein